MPYKYNPFTGNLGIADTGGSGSGVTQLDGDIGSATPSGGVITITGSLGITTIAAASAVDVRLVVPIVETLGGTGQTTYATGDILYASAANTLSKLSAGTEGYVLTITGGIPMWQDNGTGDVESVLGTLDRITSSGGANPVIDIAATYVGQTSITTLGTITTGTWNGSTVTVPYGGTGVTSLTQYGVVLGNGVGNLGVTAAATNGQILIGATGANPAFANITPGTGITITEAANSVTISTSGGGITWSVETSTPISALVNHGYVANLAGLITFTLPATSTVGSMITVTNMNTAVGWRIAQNAGNQIFISGTNTTAGVGGYLESTALGDTVTLICRTTDAQWQAISIVGNITVA
jgi:hypothetical protein